MLFSTESFKKITKNNWSKTVIGVFILFLLLDFIFPFRVNVRYSTLVTGANGSILHAFLSPDDKWRMFTQLNEITPELRKAILYKEDRWFFWHIGINPVSIVRAMTGNILSGKRTSGASTITMQVARMLQPKQRSYTNKLLEIWHSIQLEWHYSKNEILQLYVNLVPYSSNIEGMKSASVLYFQKSPDRLSLAEIATLAIIPNRPSSLRLGINNAYILKERNRWLHKFGTMGVFAPNDIANALTEPLVAKRHEAPKLAPHLSIRLKQEFKNEPLLKTTLQPQKQAIIEQLVGNYAEQIRQKNIQNACALVINNKTHTVIAYVGSSGFENREDGGQVDGIRAIRSPGSTLKPLLYAIAFDNGLFTPKSILNDVPTNFGGFEPENFDRQFHGKVSLTFALANSLNIPAVKVLKEVGTSVFIEKLKKSNFATIKKNAPHLGLSLVLGGCGVTLEELTNLFSAFANKGHYTKASFLQSNIPNTGTEELVSEESAYMLHQILTQVTRPDVPHNYEYTYHLPKIAWKTGTSFGKKDAWSIGYNQQYTVGVWLGNFSGIGIPELSGAEIATPLLFEIFNAIDYNSPANVIPKPENVYSRKICAESGNIPNDFCTNIVLDSYIPGISDNTLCQHLKKVWIAPNGEYSFCSQCMPDSGAIQRLFPNHSPELISYFEQKHILYTKIPKHNPSCENLSVQINAPIITFPNDGNEYFIEKDAKQELLLSCQVANDVKTVYWYINNILIRKSGPVEEVFFRPEVGNLKISCTDDHGRNTHIKILVKY